MVRDFLKQRLPPWAVERLRHSKWLGNYYLPRLITSAVVKRPAEIEGYSSAAHSELQLDQLQQINTLTPTYMCRVMTWHGSDKGRGWHNYTSLYSRLLGKRRGEPLVILELGLGTNNPKLVSTMGIEGRPGASLRGWRELFPNALIYGADIDRDILFEEDRIQTFYCDQLNREAIRELWAQPVFANGCDLIIDDGLHTFEGNASFLEESLRHLRPNGLYVIEDIVNDSIGQWREQLDRVYSKQFPDHDFVLAMLPNPLNGLDNNLLLAFRRQ